MSSFPTQLSDTVHMCLRCCRNNFSPACIGYSFAVLAEITNHTIEIISLYWIQNKRLVLSGELCCGGFELKYPGFHCRHLFHKSCVDPWLLDHRTCPMCKMNILKALGIPVSMSQSSRSGQKGNKSYLGISLALCLSVPILLFLPCYWFINWFIKGSTSWNVWLYLTPAAYFY